ALVGHQRLEVKRAEAKIGHHFGDIEIEKVGACFGHQCGSGLGELQVIVRCTTTAISAYAKPTSRAFLRRSNSGRAWCHVASPAHNEVTGSPSKSWRSTSSADL